MSGLNRVQLIGRLGRDPEGKTLTNGGRVVSFSIATSETWKDKATGERKERTEWHNIVVFNDGLGKIAEQYLKKGSQVYLEGKMSTREYTDKDGNQRKTTEVVLAQFGGALVLLGEKGEGRPAPSEDSYGTTKSSGARPHASEQKAPRSLSEDIDDSIPF